jgi:hypothetical protein
MTAYTVTDTPLDVTGQNLPDDQQQNVGWLDYINPNTNYARFVGTAWCGKWYATKAEADAIVAQLASLGITAYTVQADA